MKKIALIVNVNSEEPLWKDRLKRLSADFALFGGEVDFFGVKYGGMIKSPDELADFKGAVINLTGSMESTWSDVSAENASNSFIPADVSAPEGVDELKITVEGVYLDKSGYALYTRNMALGLDKLGADVQLFNQWFVGSPEMKKVAMDAARDETSIYLTKQDGSVYEYKPQVDGEQTKRIVELCQKDSEPEGRTLIACLPAAAPTDPIYRRVREQREGFARYIGYTMFEMVDLPSAWVEGCECMDEIWVPSMFNLDSFSQAGVPKDKIKLVPLGVDVDFFDPDRVQPMEIPGLKGFNFLSIFQWTKRKGWDILIKAYLEAFKQADDVALVIRSYYRNGRETESLVRRYIEELGFDVNKIPRISVVSEPIISQYMPSLYKACQAFVLPTRGEGWGLTYMEAMAMGLPTIGTRFSANLDFMNDENSFLIDNLGIEPVDEEQVRDNLQYAGLSWGKPSFEHTVELMRYVYENRGEASNRAERARRDILQNWTVEHQAARTAWVLIVGAKGTAGSGIEINSEDIAEPETESDEKAAPEVMIRRRSEPLRVAMQNRPNSLEAPGGDTVVMQNLKRELEKLGVIVDFNFILEGLERYDIVHIFNFVLAEMVKVYAENAVRQGKPFIITPLYEDWPLFLNPSFKAYYLFKEYIERGQPGGAFDEIFAPLKMLKPHMRADNGYNVRLAGGITTNGAREAQRVVNDYPFARNVTPVYFGCDITEHKAGAELFINETGLKDFVLCVGRLETRKNQLMLLKALEDEEVPVVFATGGFTYQGKYAELCQRFKRRGRTIFLDRLSDETLVSAYMAAKVHALPSWYELPGMVSVEAAHYDCNVVASPWGTIEDYLGDFAYYAEPDNPEEIRGAVMRALDDPVKPGLREHVKQFTWEKAAKTTLEVYEKALNEYQEVGELLSEAAQCRSDGKIDESLTAYRKALEIHPDNVRALRSAYDIASINRKNEAQGYAQRLSQIELDRRKKATLNIPMKLEDGFVFEEYDKMAEAFEMMERKAYKEAEELFRTIISEDKRNHRAWYGLGRICYLRGGFKEAEEYSQKSIDINPEGESLIALAEAQAKLNLPDRALTTIDLIKDLPGINGNFEFDINRVRGQCLLRKGDYDEAEQCYRKAAEIDGGSEKPYLGLGSLELMKRDFDKAEGHYRTAIQKNPHSDKAHLGIALLRIEQGKGLEALKEAKRALDLNIENQQALMLCVRAGHTAGKLSETEKYLSRYAELHPDNTAILYTLAGIRFSLGDKDKAMEAARRILSIKPDHQAAAELIEQMG